jgi:hypothetical protein
MYNRIVGGESVGYKYARKKQEVFDLYKSMAEGFKKGKPSLFLPVVALLIIAGVSWFLLMPGRLQKTKNASVASSALAEEKSISSKSMNQDFIYAGRVGDDHLLQEVSSGRIFKIIDLNGKFIYLTSSESELTLFDTEKLINVNFKRMSNFIPPESKSVLK